MKLLKTILLALPLFQLAACSINAPSYQPSFENVQLLKEANNPVHVTPFTANTASLGKITLRGNSLKSPYGEDLIHYIQKSFESELEKAGLLNPSSDKKISAVILENDINARGMSTGEGLIRAKFKISEKGILQYEKEVSSKLKWSSSFIGAIAIPNAANSYPKLTTGLFSELYSDPEFIEALKQ